MIFSVIGIGNMGQALVSGFLSKGILQAQDIRFVILMRIKLYHFLKKQAVHFLQKRQRL